MLKISSAIAAALLAFAFAAPVSAKDYGPMKEIDGLTGPAQPKGFAVKTLHVIELGQEFPNVPDAANLEFRARFVTLQPGGIVLIHSHKGRPATTYIINGEAIEHRSDTTGPILRKAREATMDVGGIAQWWENTTDETVTMFVVDVVSPTSPTDQ